jgi:hypothetical protein
MEKQHSYSCEGNLKRNKSAPYVDKPMKNEQ